MTLESPLWLLALLALPVLYLLARSIRKRRAVPVSSLLIWRRMGLGAEPPRKLARRADRLLLLRLLAAGLVALGLSGPRLHPGDPEPVVEVLIDNSPSMSAFRPGVEAALDEIRMRAPAGATLRITRSPVSSGLRAISERLGAADIVIVTDHPPPGLESKDGSGRVRLVLIGTPVENVGFTSAWLTDGQYGGVVTSYAPVAREVTIHHPAGPTVLTLSPGERRVITGPANGDPVEIEIRPGDRFGFDDRVVLTATLPTEVALAWKGPREPALELALEVAGVILDPASSESVAYRVAPDPTHRLVVSPPGPAREVDLQSLSASGGLPAEACPPPGLPLGPAAVLGHGGHVLLSDRGGALARLDGKTVTLALDPADPDSQWTRDPSFVVFIFEVARILGVAGPGHEVREGVIDPAESATRPVSNVPNLAGLIAGVADEPDPGFGLAGVLFLLGGLILLLHLVVEAGWLPTRAA